MSQLVTRCPHCSTSFHVNEQQLRAARGAVRCGSCLQVFRADENIVFGNSGPGKNIESLLEDDDFLIHDDIDLGGDEKAAAKAPGAKSRAAEDEPLIGDAFGDSEWQGLPAKSPEEEGEEDSEVLAPNWDDRPWSDESPEPPQKRESSLATRWEDLPPPDDRLPRNAAREGAATDAGHDSFSAKPDRERLISAIEPAPLEVAWRPKRDRRLPNWLWAILALLLLAGLAVQMAYFRFDHYSKQQPWRTIYAQICPRLGCQLPSLVDLQAIRTSNLVVRSHPQKEGALVVDAVLLNTAGFAQPFPGLLLSFSDLKGRPVASRRFAPREYLQGELAGRKQMPAGSPVHIAIEIVDPGSKAVNYELHIAP